MSLADSILNAARKGNVLTPKNPNGAPISREPGKRISVIAWDEAADAKLLRLRDVERLDWVQIGLRFEKAGETCRNRYTKVTGKALTGKWRAEP